MRYLAAVCDCIPSPFIYNQFVNILWKRQQYGVFHGDNMKATTIFNAALCIAALLFVSFSSPKNAELKGTKTASQETQMLNESTTESNSQADAYKGSVKTVTGKLFKSEGGNYTLVTKIKSRSRTDYHLVSAEGYEEAYAKLDAFADEIITVTGTVVEYKNPWNWTIAVTQVGSRN